MIQVLYGATLVWLFYVVFSNGLLSGYGLLATYLLASGLYAVSKNLGLLPKKSLKDQHVFITGAGSGIGRLIALKLAKLGCKITLADINEESVQKVAQQIGSQAKIFIVKCDVSSVEQVKQCAQTCVKALGDVDILINNAGIVSGKKILQNSEAMIFKTIDVNTISHHWTVRAFLPKMLENDRGHIITIASMAGIVGVAGLADYCASKFGAVGFDESLRMEVKSQKSKVQTTCICPFYINTGMFEGVTSKFTFFLPILEENYAAQRIVWAIQQDEPIVFMPWFCNVNTFLKSILPVSFSDFNCDLFGSNQSMDHFIGRKIKQ